MNLSGETLHQIVDSVKRVAEVVSEISNACSEQSLAIESVNSAVASVDMVTQVNAAQSEELSSTVKELLSNSAELEAMVGSFRIEGVGEWQSFILNDRSADDHLRKACYQQRWLKY